MNSILLIADISRMFYAIKYHKEIDYEKTKMLDMRDLDRFLWNPASDPKQPPKAYKFLSVLMGARDSPNVSTATVRHHLDKIASNSSDPDEIEVAKLIKKRLYIDDLLLSVNGVDQAIKTRQITSNIFEKAGMKMTKWLASNDKVLLSIPEEYRAPIEDLGFNMSSEEKTPISLPTKVIGMVWKPKQDEFSFEQYKKLAQEVPKEEYTKRFVSSLVAKIYDVNGYLAPFILRGKMILQKCWTHLKEDMTNLD